MLDRRREIYFSVFVCVGAAHEDKICVVLHCPVEDLAAILQPLCTKARPVVARRGDTDHQLIGVRLCRLFEDVILLRRFVGVDFVGDDDITVKRVLFVRVGCQRVQTDGASRQILMADTVPETVVEDLPAVRLRLFSAAV